MKHIIWKQLLCVLTGPPNGFFNPLSVNPTKWSNTETVRRGDNYFVGLVLKGLKGLSRSKIS